MALVRNTRAVFTNPGTYGGVYGPLHGNWIKGGLRNRFVGGLDARFGALSSGALHPGAFILPQKAGGIAGRKTSTALSTSAPLVPAYNLVGSAAGVLSLTDAELQQIVSLVASATAALTVAAALLGSAAQITASSTMTLSTTNALCGAIITSIATGACALSPSVVLTALGHMTADAGGPTELSPEGLANAVLDALLADHILPGSVGEALGNVGASGNPWSSDLSSNTTPDTFGEAVQAILKKVKYIQVK